MRWFASVAVPITMSIFAVASCGDDGHGGSAVVADLASGGGGGDLSNGGGDLAGKTSSVDCSSFTPCENDPTGTWKYTGQCGSTSFLCQGATYDDSGLDGKLVFNPDKSFSLDWTGAATFSVPASCPPRDGGFVLGCADLAKSPGFMCTNHVDGSCDCRYDYASAPGMGNLKGTWQFAGGKIQITPAGGGMGAFTLPTCVKDNTLRYSVIPPQIMVWSR